MSELRMNDAFIWHFNVYCCTPKALYNHVGGSLLNLHQCAASTWMKRRLPQDNGASALTTHQLQVERRESHRANQILFVSHLLCYWRSATQNALVIIASQIMHYTQCIYTLCTQHAVYELHYCAKVLGHYYFHHQQQQWF